MDIFHEVLKKHNIIVPEHYYNNKNNNYMEAYESVKKILSNGDNPTAFFCYSDFCALGLAKAINEFNLKIPEDISVVCFGSFEMNQFLTFKISTIKQNLKKMGETAGEVLFKMMKDKNNISNIVIKPEICY